MKNLYLRCIIIILMQNCLSPKNSSHYQLAAEWEPHEAIWWACFNEQAETPYQQKSLKPFSILCRFD